MRINVKSVARPIMLMSIGRTLVEVRAHMMPNIDHSKRRLLNLIT
jgi:hypothetical protein